MTCKKWPVLLSIVFLVIPMVIAEEWVLELDISGIDTCNLHEDEIIHDVFSGKGTINFNVSDDYFTYNAIIGEGLSTMHYDAKGDRDYYDCKLSEDRQMYWVASGVYNNSWFNITIGRSMRDYDASRAHVPCYAGKYLISTVEVPYYFRFPRYNFIVPAAVDSKGTATYKVGPNGYGSLDSTMNIKIVKIGSVPESQKKTTPTSVRESFKEPKQGTYPEKRFEGNILEKIPCPQKVGDYTVVRNWWDKDYPNLGQTTIMCEYEDKDGKQTHIVLVADSTKEHVGCFGGGISREDGNLTRVSASHPVVIQNIDTPEFDNAAQVMLGQAETSGLFEHCPLETTEPTINPTPGFVFDIDVEPHLTQIFQGAAANAQVSVKRVSGEPQPVGLSATRWDPKIELTVGMAGTHVTPPGASAVFVTTTCNTPPGLYPITVIGTAARSISSSVDTFNVDVRAAPWCNAVWQPLPTQPEQHGAATIQPNDEGQRWTTTDGVVRQKKCFDSGKTRYCITTILGQNGEFQDANLQKFSHINRNHLGELKEGRLLVEYKPEPANQAGVAASEPSTGAPVSLTWNDYTLRMIGTKIFISSAGNFAMLYVLNGTVEVTRTSDPGRSAFVTAGDQLELDPKLMFQDQTPFTPTNLPPAADAPLATIAESGTLKATSEKEILLYGITIVFGVIVGSITLLVLLIRFIIKRSSKGKTKKKQ
jgi:hypothetical protein